MANCFYYGTIVERNINKAYILYEIAKVGFIQRIQSGDKYTDKLLEKTNKMLNNIIKNNMI